MLKDPQIILDVCARVIPKRFDDRDLDPLCFSNKLAAQILCQWHPVKGAFRYLHQAGYVTFACDDNHLPHGVTQLSWCMPSLEHPTEVPVKEHVNHVCAIVRLL